MSEYELIDAMIGSFGLGISSIVFYLTVLSSFLIVAYFAGDKLKRTQMAIVTGLFILAALFGTWSTTTFLMAGRELHLLQSTIPIYSTKLAPHQWLLPLELFGIFASLKFMWDVRHSKTE